MNIFIPNHSFKNFNKKALFILVRPFIKDNKWSNEDSEKMFWNIPLEFNYVDEITNAQVVFLPLAINTYFKLNRKKELFKINDLCLKQGLKAYGYISDDFGEAYPDFSNIIYFRMGGFKNQLTKNNKGFPVALSDHFKRIYKQEIIIPTKKKNVPIIGFCGHASSSKIKELKELTKIFIENSKRFLKHPLRKDYEPFFASAYQRAKILNYLSNSNILKTNFILRKNYRGGAKSETEREQTTLEYYQNIFESNYVICIRGGGNFSVRLYETLMLGKIPVFINTKCLLPFENKINWKEHVVWVEWKDRKRIATIVSDFHNKLTDEKFMEMQLENRKLWKETLSISGILKMIANDI